MKKTAAIIAIVALTAASAMAYPGFRGNGGPCYGQGGGGFGPGAMGPGYGRGAGAPCVQVQQGEPVDVEGAKAKVSEYLASNLKGYEIKDAVSMERPGGTVYRFQVADDNGNTFVLVVNPFGQLRGPIPVKVIK